jgi:glycosyltransferase involved in cell wall biosynthesis
MDEARPAADEAELLRRDPVVLAAGRLIPEKGFGLLISALARIDLPQARLVILGDGPQRGALADEARARGVAERIDMPGYVAKPWEYFRRARVCAISSRSESFSNVAVEALAHGLPVVSTDCGGPGEIISRPEEGSLVPIDDEPAMAQALAAALGAPGDPAPRVARAQTFSVDRAVDAYQRLFAEVIAEAEGAARTG